MSINNLKDRFLNWLKESVSDSEEEYDDFYGINETEDDSGIDISDFLYYLFHPIEFWRYCKEINDDLDDYEDGFDELAECRIVKLPVKHHDYDIDDSVIQKNDAGSSKVINMFPRKKEEEQ